MAYATQDIITWMKICQPLARLDEQKKKAVTVGSLDIDLDMKLYITRLDIEYALNDGAPADVLFAIGNFGLSLCGVHLLTAQGISGGGGSVTPVVPASSLDPYDFEVSPTSFIVTGATSKIITDFIGYNIIFVRNRVTQSRVNMGDTYYSWDKVTGLLTLFGPSPANGAAQTGEPMQIFPL
jgi:hypothetical protein